MPLAIEARYARCMTEPARRFPSFDELYAEIERLPEGMTGEILEPGVLRSSGRSGRPPGARPQVGISGRASRLAEASAWKPDRDRQLAEPQGALRPDPTGSDAEDKSRDATRRRRRQRGGSRSRREDQQAGRREGVTRAATRATRGRSRRARA
jgi:hypothetical protein